MLARILTIIIFSYLVFLLCGHGIADNPTIEQPVEKSSVAPTSASTFLHIVLKQTLIVQQISRNKVDENKQLNNVTYRLKCQLDPNESEATIQITNSTQLLSLMQIIPNITSLQTPASCLVIFFYSPSCPFSCMAAPHFNALPRAFPELPMAAVDTSTRHNLNAQFGIVGVPSLLLFHNGRVAARFNKSKEYNLSAFSKFIRINTGLKPQGSLVVKKSDFDGPISSIVEISTDYFLIFSWCFIIACAAYYFYFSSLFQWLLESVRSAWIEAEAHQHLE